MSGLAEPHPVIAELLGATSRFGSRPQHLLAGVVDSHLQAPLSMSGRRSMARVSARDRRAAHTHREPPPRLGRSRAEPCDETVQQSPDADRRHGEYNRLTDYS